MTEINSLEFEIMTGRVSGTGTGAAGATTVNTSTSSAGTSNTPNNTGSNSTSGTGSGVTGTGTGLNSSSSSGGGGGAHGYCLKWKFHPNNLLHMFNQLLLNESFTDVVVACEGKVIKCHKVSQLKITHIITFYLIFSPI